MKLNSYNDIAVSHTATKIDFYNTTYTNAFRFSVFARHLNVLNREIALVCVSYMHVLGLIVCMYVDFD